MRILSVFLLSLTVLGSVSSCSEFNYVCKAEKWFEGAEQTALSDLKSDVESAITSCESEYQNLETSIVDQFSLSTLTSEANTAATDIINVISELALFNDIFSAADLTFTCLSSTSVSIPWSVSFDPSNLDISVNDKTFSLCTEPSFSGSNWTTNTTKLALAESAAISVLNSYISLASTSSSKSLKNFKKQSSISNIGDSCSLDFGLSISFGMNAAAGVTEGVSVGFAVGCDGSKARFEPIWSWQAGVTTNIVISAGIEVQYSTWDQVEGSNIGIGVSGGYKYLGGSGIAWLNVPTISISTKDYDTDITFKIGDLYSKTYHVDFGTYPDGLSVTGLTYAGVSLGISANLDVLPVDGTIVYSYTYFISD